MTQDKKRRPFWLRGLLIVAWLGSILIAVELGSRNSAFATGTPVPGSLEDATIRHYRQTEQTQGELIDVLREIRNQLQNIGQCACRDR